MSLSINAAVHVDAHPRIKNVQMEGKEESRMGMHRDRKSNGGTRGRWTVRRLVGGI